MFKTKYRISTYESDGTRYYVPEYKYWFWPLWHAFQVMHQGGGCEPSTFYDIQEAYEFIDGCKKEIDKPVMVSREYR